MIIIDASELILGRLASYAAKQLLLGESVRVVNCEKAVISGRKENVFAEYLHRMERGAIRKGPFLLRMPDKIVRRTVRGMIPFKKAKGQAIFRKLYCYVGVPEELKDKKAITIDSANVSKLPTLRYVNLGTLSKRLGAKLE